MISEYTSVCPSMPEYAGILVKMSKSACLAFVKHVSIVISCLLECLIVYFSQSCTSQKYVKSFSCDYVSRNLISSIVL